MNEDGEFVCDEHKPEQRQRQWLVELDFTQECKCDHCDKQATFYVLEKQ